MTAYTPPYPPYDPTDKSGFSYETVARRWPIILTSLIDAVYQENMRISDPKNVNPEQSEAKLTEGKTIIQTIAKLKYEMGHNQALQGIPDDGEPNVEVFNAGLRQLAVNGKNTWFSAPWLYAECYLYRLVRTYFSTSTYWKEYDPFHAQKEQTFRSSASAIYQLAHTFAELDQEKDIIRSDPAKLEVLFNEMLQMCLWGNATDLSLLTNMTHEDIQKLQSVGKAAQQERKEYILLDQSKEVWSLISNLKDATIDIVLDNAGFELFTDLLLADFLVTHTPYVSRVNFHPKTIPWFVSDVMPPDFHSVIPSLLNTAYFGKFSPSAEQTTQLENLVQRWQKYISSGAFSLSVESHWRIGDKSEMADFWTTQYPYAVMPTEAQTLTAELKKSALVIFKGDLNYRKLTADVEWPPSTPFPTALGPLAGTFPILSLRTLKADVAVGLTDEIAKTLDGKDPKWRVNGK
ncbi:DUF89 domain-containing protein [Hysterangium stoloniferum]|nr:DUF89 domain-containing protein [Hysterangium stoloniferum]